MSINDWNLEKWDEAKLFQSTLSSKIMMKIPISLIEIQKSLIMWSLLMIKYLCKQWRTSSFDAEEHGEYLLYLKLEEQ